MSKLLITAEVKILTPELIMELLENGYTRFQDENTFENESIQNYLIQHFPNIFNNLNVKNQITVMFSREPLKGKRTQKVIRQAFNWGMTNQKIEVEVEVIQEENWANSPELITVPAEYKEEEVVVEEDQELVEANDHGVMPWDM